MTGQTIYKDSYEAYSDYNKTYSAPSSYSAPATTTKKWGNWNWGNWGSSYSIDTLEEKMRRKKLISNKIDSFKKEHSIIAKTTIGGANHVSRVGSIYSLTIPNNDEYGSELNKLGNKVNIWKMFPQTPVINKSKNLVEELVPTIHEAKYKKEGINAYYQKFFMNKKLEIDMNEVKNRYQEMDKIFKKSFITEDDFLRVLQLIPKVVQEEMEDGEKGHGGISGGRGGQETPRFDNKVSISTPPTKVIKEPSLLRGKRINRQYINHSDYRPLINKKVEDKKAPELLILLDGSGSMTDTNSEGNSYYHEAINFAADLYKTGAFKINMIHTDSYAVENVSKDIENFSRGKSTQFMGTGGAEGFEVLTTRLSEESRTEDYVLVLTDMIVPDEAEDNLREFIGQKKHLILSFGADKKFNKLNVRFVQGVSDMKNVITTLLG